MTLSIPIQPDEQLEDLGIAGLQILQSPRYFKFSIDAVLLAWFAAPAIRPASKVADLGTGTGILPLLLYGRTGVRHVDALELQPAVADMAARSVAINRLTDVIHIRCGDLRQPGPAFRASAYDAVISNPPFMPMGHGGVNPDDALAIARHEITCTLEDIARFAQTMLKDRGKLFLVHRADRLADIAVTLRGHGLELKGLRAVHPKPDKPANLVLCEAMKKGRPGLTIAPPLTIYREDGRYSDAVNAIYGTDGPCRSRKKS
jgi:tRNA1Val (adenine37-N6)-methyltransferase